MQVAVVEVPLALLGLALLGLALPVELPPDAVFTTHSVSPHSEVETHDCSHVPVQYAERQSLPVEHWVPGSPVPRSTQWLPALVCPNVSVHTSPAPQSSSLLQATSN